MDILKFSNLAGRADLTHCVATRHIGNVSFSASRAPDEVLRNREKLAQAIGASSHDFVVAGLVHGDKVAIVIEGMRGRGAFDADSIIPATDAMITRLRRVCLMIPVADCVPILLFDPQNNAIGIVHAGWKGTLKKIAEKTVTRMHSEFGTDPGSLLAGIGPCICVKHYEVDEAVLPRAKGHLDLRAANKLQLEEVGVATKNIEIMDYCTYERTDIFFSHRAEGATGRFATAIMIK